MDFSDAWWILIVALWLLPYLSRILRQKETELPSRSGRGPRVPVAGLAAERVARVQRVLGDASAACDPRMARVLTPLLQSMNDDLESARRSVAEGPSAPDLLQRLGGLETTCRHMMAVGQQRATASLMPLHETGDRLSEALFRLLQEEAERTGLALDMRPPLVVVGASSRTPLAGTVALPVTVHDRPWEWTVLAEALGDRIADATVEEAFGALQLDVGDDQPLTADSPALARLLFGSWLYLVIADATALLLLGPASVRALAARLRAPGRARSVTQVKLSGRGLDPNPPPHARIHLAAEWLALQGEEQASRQIREAWDEEHGHPEALSLLTSRGEMLLPVRAVLGHFHDILEDLDGLRLAALGRRRLAELPGLSGWSREARTARTARDRLVRGEAVTVGPRALLAATAEAALDSPAAGPSISAALLASLRGEGRAPRKPLLTVPRERRVAAAPRRKVSRGMRVAEALLIGELILDRPSRR